MEDLFALLLSGRNRKLMQQLRFDPRQVNAENEEGDTLLHLAAFRGDLRLAEHLKRVEADLDKPNHQGRTPLHVAAQEDQASMADWLIKQGAAIEKRDRQGATPLCLASGSGAFHAAETLLRGGAILDLNTAVALNRPKELRQLLEAGVTLIQAPFPDRLLYEASFHRHREVIEILLEYGADPNLAMQGTSPLHAAVSGTKSDPRIVEMLLKAGANPKVRDSVSTQTPLELALRVSADSKIIEMLQTHGG